MTSFRLNSKTVGGNSGLINVETSNKIFFLKEPKARREFLHYLAVYLVMVKFYSWGHFVLCDVQLLLCQYVLLASRNTYPFIDNSVANYRPHLSHFWKM